MNQSHLSNDIFGFRPYVKINGYRQICVDIVKVILDDDNENSDISCNVNKSILFSKLSYTTDEYFMTTDVEDLSLPCAIALSADKALTKYSITIK